MCASLFILQDTLGILEFEEEVEDPIGKLSMVEVVDLYEPMIRDYMDQELYQIDMRQDFNAQVCSCAR